MKGLTVDRGPTPVPQRAMRIILGITVAQWSRAMRAEGALRRATALEKTRHWPAGDDRREPVGHDDRTARPAPDGQAPLP